MFRMSCAVALLLCAAATNHIRAEAIPGCKIVGVREGAVEFDKDGRKYRLKASSGMKLFDDKGEVQDLITGVGRFLAPGNVVDITTTADRKTRKNEVTEIRFVSGTIAKQPETPTNIELKPDPNFKGQDFGGDGYTSSPYWQSYIPTARVGDFVEYHRQTQKNAGRMETVEVGKDYVVIAKVFYTRGSRQEQREKHRLPPKGSDARKGPLDGLPGRKSRSGNSPTEKVEVAGRMLECHVESGGGKPDIWRSAEVPFDGLVKEVSKGKPIYMLDAFGRGAE